MDLEKYLKAIERIDPIKQRGKVTQVVGLLIESLGPSVSVGEICDLVYSRTAKPVKSEVVGFKERKVLLMPLGPMLGIGPGTEVVATHQALSVGVGRELLGRILNGLGEPMDGKGPLVTSQRRSVYASPPHPLERKRIKEPLPTGIRAIDGLLTCGKGQRVGIFAGSGVGKSVLLGMIAKKSEAAVNVIGLIGERGREVRDFIERDLGEEGLKRSVVVVATSDQPPLIRLKGALVATTIAEFFRDEGFDVMLMMDSVTRIAMAQREIGLAIGEPPTSKGYTPSTFAFLPQFLERAGNSHRGSITGLYTILVEGDDMNEPISDACRAILDGHIALSRKLASQNHYPAIDVLESVSRVMIDVVGPEHMEAAKKLHEALATYRDSEDLINIGAYVPGSNKRIDYSISMIDRINSFLKQDIEEDTGYEETVDRLIGMFKFNPAQEITPPEKDLAQRVG